MHNQVYWTMNINAGMSKYSQQLILEMLLLCEQPPDEMVKNKLPRAPVVSSSCQGREDTAPHKKRM